MTAVAFADRLAYTAHEAAELVGVSANTMRRLIAAGTIARVPFSGRTLVARSELERWLTSGPEVTA